MGVRVYGESLTQHFTPDRRRAMIRRFIEVHNAPPDGVSARHALACAVRDFLCDIIRSEPVLFFGTLLGCVRDSRLMEWDHDFDMVLPPRGRPWLAKALRSPRKPWRQYGLELVRVEEYVISFADATGLSPGEYCDVYPYCAPPGESVYTFSPDTLHPQWDIARQDLDRPDSGRLLAIDWAIPRNATLYLERMYGADWQTPKRTPPYRIDWDVETLYR